MKLSLIAAAAGLLLSGATMAHTSVYTTPLLPTSASFATGSGSVILTIDWDDETMRVQATYSGLSGPSTAAHIHCCTTTPGVVGGAIVASSTPSYPGFAGSSSGSYDMTFSLTDPVSFSAGFINNTSFGGSGSLPAAVTAFGVGLSGGKAYFNVHTSNVPGGEIQGFLTLAPVPEPQSYALMALGLLGLVAYARRRRS